MRAPLTRDITDRGGWLVNPKGVWNAGLGKVLPAGATELAVTLQGAPLEALLEQFGEVRGLWLNGAVTVADLTALARLGSLRELHISTTFTAELLEAVIRLRGLERLRLVAVDPTLLEKLAGLTAKALSINLKAGAGVTAGWKTLLGLPVTELRIKSGDPKPPLPPEAAQALGDTATVRTLYLEGVALADEVLTSLLRSRSLETVTLDKYGAPAEVVVTGAPHLKRLELLGTNVAAMRLRDLPVLEHFQGHHAKHLALTNLAALRVLALPTLTGTLTVELASLPALEHLDATNSALSQLTLNGVPALRRIDLRKQAGPAGAELVAAARATKAEVLVDSAPPAARKRSAEKRKLAAKAWVHPQLGWDGNPWGVLIAGRLADQEVSAAKAKELGLVCEVWSKQEGVHLTAALPHDARESDELGPVIVGKVLGLVGAKNATATVDAAALDAALKAVDALKELWAESAGVLGNDALETARTALYLVACGPGAHVSLARGGTRVSWVDEGVVPFAAVEVAGPGSLVLQLG